MTQHGRKSAHQVSVSVIAAVVALHRLGLRGQRLRRGGRGRDRQGGLLVVHLLAEFALDRVERSLPNWVVGAFGDDGLEERKRDGRAVGLVAERRGA